MNRILATSSAAMLSATVLSLAACSVGPPPAPQETVMVTQPQQQVVMTTGYAMTPTMTSVVVPVAPPAPLTETIPPRPYGTGPYAWQPGRWNWTGNPGQNWAWQSGQYVVVPSGRSTWVQGGWTDVPNVGWRFVEGHWM